MANQISEISHDQHPIGDSSVSELRTRVSLLSSSWLCTCSFTWGGHWPKGQPMRRRAVAGSQDPKKAPWDLWGSGTLPAPLRTYGAANCGGPLAKHHRQKQKLWKAFDNPWFMGHIIHTIVKYHWIEIPYFDIFWISCGLKRGLKWSLTD